MKKIVSIIALQLMTYSCFSQIVRNENAGFAIHPGHTAAQPDHWTFIWQNNDCYAFNNPWAPGGPVDNDVPGWTISHGHPLVSHISDATCMGLEYSLEDGCGHGIAATYKFQAGISYSVIIGFCPDDPIKKTDFTKGSLQIKMTKTHPGGRNMIYCCDPVPYTPISQPVGTVTNSNFNRAYNRFDFTASQNFDFLMVYPEQYLPGNKTRAYINFVNIYRNGCIPEKYITGNFIPDENYTYYENLYAGSIHGGPTLTAVDPSKRVDFVAKDKILIQNNFYASAFDGNYFVAQIYKNLCGVPAPPQQKTTEESENISDIKNDLLSSPTQLSSFGMQKDNFIAKETSLGLSTVYPNPNGGSFKLQIPFSDNCELTIVNMIGTVVYKTILKGESTKQIQMDDKLPVGNYTIYVKGENFNHVEKLVITK